MPAPEGEIPDFYGTSSLQITILVVYITTSCLATIGIILRLYTGVRLVHYLGLDACKYHPFSQNVVLEFRTHEILPSPFTADPNDLVKLQKRLAELLAYSLSYCSMGRVSRLIHWHGRSYAVWLWKTPLERDGERIVVLQECQSSLLEFFLSIPCGGENTMAQVTERSISK